jgi:RimJ/RimL family protein N-acetyltransferase
MAIWGRSVRRRRTLLRDGTAVWLRPVVPADRRAFEAGFTSLSERSRYLRFHRPVAGLSDEVWHALVDEVDQHRHVALLMLAGRDPVGVGRVVRSADDPATVDLAVTVRDEWQGRGAGTALARAVLVAAGGVRRIETVVLEENVAAMRLLASLGAPVTERSGRTLRVTVDLAELRAA